MSYSDIEREILRAKRKSVISDMPLSQILEEMISNRSSGLALSDRKRLGKMLGREGYGQRETHRLTGLSRDTIRRHDTPAEEPEDSNG